MGRRKKEVEVSVPPQNEGEVLAEMEVNNVDFVNTIHTPIAKVSVDFPSEQLNTLARTLNEVIERVNG